MATSAIIVLVIVVVVLAAAAVAGALLLRRRALRRRFGPEYDQLASQVGERRAQAELTDRERRVSKLDIRPLSPERRAGYRREWLAAEEKFVDSPGQSVQAAATLVSAVAADRGYPADDEDRLLDDLSVHHAQRLDGYRRARRTTEQADTAGTEDLRQALLSYRELFRELIGSEPGDGHAPGTTQTAASDSTTPAAATARDSRARGDGDGTAAEGDTADGGTAASRTPAAGDRTGAETTTAGGGTWVDSGRDDRAASPAARRE